jgi:hypothetical protein
MGKSLKREKLEELRDFNRKKKKKVSIGGREQMN